MPDVEPLRFPSREGRRSQPDPADLQAICTGRRRTCALLNSPLPCVNKAVNHIQELKMIVKDWCQQDRHQFSKTGRFQSRDSDTESVMSTELFVEGVAINSRETCALTLLLKKVNDVLGEVMYLIERLEAERQYAEEALHKERKRKRFLESQVDGISLWKQQERSQVVQKEHEACHRDIAELKRQLKVARGELDQAQEKLAQSEVPNQRLHDDISFTKKQIPIVRENLERQRGLINQIQTAQSEADELYSKTHNDHVRVQNELKKTEQDTENEKASLEQAELVMKNKLTKKLEDLHQSEMIEKGLCAGIKDAEKMISLTEEKCAATTKQILGMTELEKTEKEQILQLKNQMEEEIKPTRKLNEKITALQEDIEKNRLQGEAEVSCTEERLSARRAALAALCENNMECQLSAEEYRAKLSRSEAAVKQMREETKHMLREITLNDERAEKATQEMTRVGARHRATVAKLREQEELTSEQEHRAGAQMEKLRRDLRSQTEALELLKRECANMSEELHQCQRRVEIINLKLQRESEDVAAATAHLETKVKKMQELTANLERTEREHGRTLIKLEEERKLKRDHLKAAQDSHAAATKRQDDLASTISDLTRSNKEQREASAEMEQRVEVMQEKVAELQSVFDVAQFRHKSAALVMSTLQSDINNCHRRARRSVQIHSAHVTARKKLMEDGKDALRIALEENKRLAREYEDLKERLVEARQEAVSALSQRNQAHQSFHYYTQLSLLQKRMHKALVEYFKQRSLYSRAELDRCQALSQETDQKIRRAQQDGLSQEIRLISAFLRCLPVDSSSGSGSGSGGPDAVGSSG
ncbi:coiled-coil domain-containing protein 178 isoform X2 [Nelusetta ayraudi]|uniref:coiled-coil domain-containing protein 178 isoform X2 n=1 Tax=Nelusetta ayraudi TaxID=303726 RepID=UPI003F6F8056